MEKIDFKNSINEMMDNFDFKVRRFPVFSFGDRSKCKSMLMAAICKVDETIVDFKWLPEYNQIVDWMTDTKGKGLLLAGNVGRGKTNIIHHALPLLFYHFKRKVIKCTHANDLYKHLDEYQNKSMISIDEMGTETIVNLYGSKYEPVNVLFDMAESKSKTLLISTNMNSDEIQERYGIRTLDRIARLCCIVKFEGESLRK